LHSRRSPSSAASWRTSRKPSPARSQATTSSTPIAITDETRETRDESHSPRAAIRAFHPSIPAFRRFALAVFGPRAYSSSILNERQHGSTQMVTIFFAFVTITFFAAIVAHVADTVSRASASI
jgi:small neutral amino acid transporter SnatA (MarC family)